MKFLLVLFTLLLFACENDTTNNVSTTTEQQEASVAPQQLKMAPPNSSDSALPECKSLCVAADKMNVFYIGVDNPVTVSAAGFDQQGMKVVATNADIRGSGSKFIVKPKRVGEVEISVSTPLHGRIGTFPFRAKRIPDPKLKLGGSFSGEIAASKFKAQRGVYAAIEGLDIDAKCSVAGFQLMRISADGTMEVEVNKGGKFTTKSQVLVNEAMPGDVYTVTDAKLRCPGDQASRVTNALVFEIK